MGFSGCTPEMSPTERVALMELHGLNVKLLIQPMDDKTPDELVQVKGTFDEKSPSQRLRAILFLLWKQENQAIDFLVYYQTKVNGIIEHLKLKLKDNQ